MAKMIRNSLLLVIALVSLCLLPQAEAGSGRGYVHPNDFYCYQIKLGDSELALEQVFGKELYNKSDSLGGITVTTHYYPGDIAISVAPRTGKVVDIVIKGKDFRMRDDVAIGATSYWLTKVFGKTPRVQLDAATCYIYQHPTKPHEHLVFTVSAQEGTLEGIRITALPLSDEEAQQMAGQPETADLFGADLDPEKIAAKDIDTSSVTSDKPIRLGGMF